MLTVVAGYVVHKRRPQHVKAWTGQDPLLVRAYIPAALLAQMADREQQANETTQGGYKLAVRIASDFQVGVFCSSCLWGNHCYTQCTGD